jgi:branched-chain amino acid aminotransferase
MLAILDGAVMDSADAHISVLDEGLLRGDGVFEVIHVYAGRPFALEEHLERMVRSAHSIRLPFDADVVRADAEALLAASGDADGALRLVVTRGGRRIGLLHPPKAFADTISLATITYSPTRVLDGVKSLSYGANMLATRLAVEAGAEEALLVSPHGRVLEGPTTSFFYVLDGELCTPPLSDRILDSISRRVLFEVTDARERVTTLDDLSSISEAFLASSLREVHPVRSIDDRAIPAAPGPVSADAAARVRAHIVAALTPAGSGQQNV